MAFAQFIHEYGYLAIAIGSFLEGEAVLLAGSLAAYHGHLELLLVFLLAAVASFCGDLPYFFAGRRFGPILLRRYPTMRRHRPALQKLLHRHQVLMVLSLRYLYGLRIAGLMALGTSRLPIMRFLVLDFIGALIWAGSVCAAGYGAGRIFQGLFGQMDARGQMLLLAALLFGTPLLVMRARRRRTA